MPEQIRAPGPIAVGITAYEKHIQRHPLVDESTVASDECQPASWPGSRAASGASDTLGAVTAHPAEPVPDADPDEAATAAAALREYREWVAAGRPGAVSHEEAMAELLGDTR